MLAGDRLDLENFTHLFPLFRVSAYDFFFEQFPDVVGLRGDVPETQKKKIAAALVSEALGLKSIDYVMKHYLSQISYPESDRNRLDLIVENNIQRMTNSFSSQLYTISRCDRLSESGHVAILSLGRLPFSIKYLILCAHSGALFEAVSIARMMIEQAAWALSVGRSSETTSIHKVSATRAISNLKLVIPDAGHFYGWLSSHVHWEFDAHSKVVVSRSGKVGHLFASCYFKALSMLVALIVVRVYFYVIWNISEDVILYISRLNQGWPVYNKDKLNNDVFKLVDEVLLCAPDDGELRMLAKFAQS